MLKAVPIGWCSWSFRVEGEAGHCAHIDMAWVRESAEVDIDGQRYRVRKSAAIGGSFELTRDGHVVATASKRMMVRAFDVRVGERHFELSALSIFGRAFGLFENEQQTGIMSPVSMWGRSAEVHFPDDISRDVQVFLIWLVLILWRRAASSAAAAG
ncbi:MAG: hypothetical protein H8E37_11085 [Planctomycetes bacterium]|nr:hypothetical protein [Planctomycetota bacterium]